MTSLDRRWLLGLLPFGLLGAAQAQPTGTNTPTPGALATAAVGQIPGNTTGVAATAGNVGELATANLTATGALTLSSGQATSIIGVGLTPGDWDVWGTVVYTPNVVTATTIVTLVQAGINATTTGLPTLISGALAQQGFGAGLTGGAISAYNTPQVPFAIAASGTAYLMASLTFSVSTTTAYGVITARRRR